MAFVFLSLLFVLQGNDKSDSMPPNWPAELQGAWEIKSCWVRHEGRVVAQPKRSGQNVIIVTRNRLYLLRERMRVIAAYELRAVKARTHDYTCLVELDDRSFISTMSKDKFVVFNHGPTSQTGYVLEKRDLLAAYWTFRDVLERNKDILVFGEAGSDADLRALIGLAETTK